MLRGVIAVVAVLSVVSVLASEAAVEVELPLSPDKTLSFQVQEATWLSLDVAPDSEQLVLEVLGDLYLLPISGGVAKPLSVGMSFDSQPRFSPDGGQIAFLSDRDGGEEVWLLDLESRETRKLTTTSDRTEFSSPAWAPDGQHIIVSRSSFDVATYELWAYAIDGGSGVQVTRAKAKKDTPRQARHNALGPVYDPSGQYLYYSRKLGGFGYNLRFPLWQIARRDMRNNFEDVITAASGSAFRPVISPDGRYLVYGTRHEQQTGLRIRTLATGVDDWLAYPIQRDEQESRFTRDLLPAYAFTSDGKSLITTRDGQIIRIDVVSKTIDQIPFTIDVEKAVAQRLDFPRRVGLGPIKARVLANSKLAPDGKKLAFAAFSRIYVHDLKTGGTVPVSPMGEVSAFPSWSPKSDALAFVSWDVSGGHIYRVRPRANSKPKQLTKDAAYYRSPVWSQDGKRIVALRGSAYERLGRQNGMGPTIGSDVIWLNAKGGDVSLVLAARGFGRPHFGPESDRIYLHTVGSPFPGKSSAGLISVRYDGTDRREVLAVTAPGVFNQGDEAGAETLQISPDGQFVLFKHAAQLYVVRLMPYLPAQKLKLVKPQMPLARLTDVGADFSAWSASGDSVTWSVGNRFYQRPLATIEFKQDEDEDPQADESNDDPEGQQVGQQTGRQVEKQEDEQANQCKNDCDQTTDDKLVKAEADEAELLEDHDAVQFTDIDLYLPRYKPEGVLAFINATVITMGDAKVINSGTVVVQGDRIAAVGPTDEIIVPAEAQVYDMRGKYLLPGFVDTHAHYRLARDVPGTSNASFLANLAYGVTTGMDVQPSTVDILSAKDLVDAGGMIGPRAFSTGPGVFSNNEFKSKAHALAVLRRYKQHYKVNNIKAYVSGSRKQRQWLIQASQELGLMPTTEGSLDMKTDLTHVIDGFSGLEHNYPLPKLYNDVVQLTGRAHTGYTPTLLVTYGGPQAENYYYTNESPHNDPKLRRFTPYQALAARTLRRSWFHQAEYVFPQIAASSRAIIEAGGQVGIGAHGQLQGLGYHWEMWSIASGGYENLQVLKLATIGGAEMLGISRDIGSLEAGKLADILILNASPLESLRNTTGLDYVMKGGDLYRANTLDQVWPEQKPLGDQWWWHAGPSETN